MKSSPVIFLLLTAIIWGAASAALAQTIDFTAARERMVADEIVGAGVKNASVIDAMRRTPRHEFVPAADREQAYFDMALPIGSGQTISPPFVVAYMTEQIDPQPTDKVLEIGTGSGYQAAVLSPLVDKVYSIEIVEPLGRRAATTLRRLKYKNVFTKVGDGYQGWAEHAPFDKIIVTCSPENVPKPLVDQLKEGGRMVVPLGERYQQTLYLFTKKEGKLVSEALRPTLFVPMTGAAEDQRRVKPDASHPALVNSGFEEIADEGDTPVGWHYLRQAEATINNNPPEGKRSLTFSNLQPGRGSQALQAFAIDVRKVPQVELSAWVKAYNVEPGQSVEQLPMLAVVFYDERRAIVGQRALGPWRGSFTWRHEQSRVKVPPNAREAILRIGLFGATGEISFDDVRVTVPAR